MIPKAFENPGFLKSRAARPIRILAEYLEPLSRFEYYGVHHTIVLMGSSRLHSRQETQQLLEQTREQLAAHPDDPELQHQVRVYEAQLEIAHYYDEAVEIARRLTAWNLRRKPTERLIICTGAGPGIMEAGNRGAHLAGGLSIGLGIELEDDEVANPYVSPQLQFLFHYFFMRKFWFVYLAKAVIFFPGGFGTMDELFEVLTLKQTGKLKKQLPLILYGQSFWERVINWNVLAHYGLIHAEDQQLFVYCNTPDEVMTYLIPLIERAHLD